VQILSSAVKAVHPTVAALPSGDFAVAWNEERFPVLLTAVARVSLGGS
jgi:hypothetical protein